MTEKYEQRAYPLPAVYAQQHRHRWTPLDGLGSWGAKHQTTLMNQALRPGWMTRRQPCINGCENEKKTKQKQPRDINYMIVCSKALG